MSRRRAGNNVRGPTSALTSFLQAQGITAATIARRVQQQNEDDNQNQDANGGQAEQQAVAGPSTLPESSSGTRRNTRRTMRASGYASDDLDAEPAPADALTAQEPEGEAAAEAEAEVSQPAPKRRKLTKAAEAKLKAAAKKRAKALKRGGGSEYEESDDEDEEDEFIPKVGGRSLWSSGQGGSAQGGASGSKPAVGSLENCAECEKQFTFTKYTIANPSGPGYLCHPCAKASGNDPFAKKPAPKRTAAPSEKRKIQHFEERRFPTLIGICIDIISKHINDIEAFGDLGSMNVEAISKALSKNRCLTAENAPLFYSVTNESLVFYDATNLTSNALSTLAQLNPNLTTLRLDFCGQIDDVAFSAFINGLPSLKHIELLGPFLIRVDAWKAFLRAHSKLESFLITQSPRFDVDCAKALVQCKDLKELRLKEIGLMSDAMLKVLGGIKKNQLTYLDISDPGNPEACTPEAIEALVKKVGLGLEYLDLSGHILIDDDVFMKGLSKHTRNLKTLLMDNLPTLTDAGVATFFESWSNPALKKLSAARNPELSSAALTAIIKHSGQKLEELNINGWKDVDEPTLTQLGKAARELRVVDVGWVRAMDDFVMKDWMEGNAQVGGLKALKEVKAWGCNRITERCPRKAGLNIYGVESQVIPVR